MYNEGQLLAIYPLLTAQKLYERAKTHPDRNFGHDRSVLATKCVGYQESEIKKVGTHW